MNELEKAEFVNNVARRNVSKSVGRILHQSHTIQRLVQEGRIAVLGAMYDVVSGRIDFFHAESVGPQTVANPQRA